MRKISNGDLERLAEREVFEGSLGQSEKALPLVWSL
jgi:hypothetical protein